MLPQNTPSVPSGVKSWAQASVTHGAHGDGECRAIWGARSGTLVGTIPTLYLRREAFSVLWLNIGVHVQLHGAHEHICLSLI